MEIVNNWKEKKYLIRSVLSYCPFLIFVTEAHLPEIKYLKATFKLD